MKNKYLHYSLCLHFCLPPAPLPPTPHTIRVPNSQRDISKAQVNHAALVPKILQWLPISARIKFKLWSPQGPCPLSSFSTPTLPFSAFFQLLIHTKLILLSGPVLPTLPGLLPGASTPFLPQPRAHSRAPPQEASSEHGINLPYFPRRTKQGPTLLLIFAYLSIYFPRLEWGPLQGRGSDLLSLNPHGVPSVVTNRLMTE